MLAHCWLHIGTGKTGTTSIQYHLAQNRSALIAQGYLYPLAPGAGNHHALCALALDDEKADGTRATLGIANAAGLAHLRRSLPEGLESEIAAAGVSNLILSNEVLAVRLREPAELERLKHLCDRIAANTTVIVYLRNQVDYLVGRYTTSILEGSPKDFDARRWARDAGYAAMLARWTAVFGRENLIVRRYERESFPDGDVRKDFLRQLGIDPGTLAETRLLNRTPDAESIAFIRGFNRHVPFAPAGRIAPLRYAIAAVLGKRQGGRAFAISQSLADRIMGAYQASNARVAAEYFPSLTSALFSSPSCVTATGTDKPLPPGRALGMMATLVPLLAYRYGVRAMRRAVETWRQWRTPRGPRAVSRHAQFALTQVRPAPDR